MSLSKRNMLRGDFSLLALNTIFEVLELLNQKKYSYRKIARLTGTSHTTVNRIANGNYHISEHFTRYLEFRNIVETEINNNKRKPLSAIFESITNNK
jgi:transcriptional regulator with XRE-family HTH domain